MKVKFSRCNSNSLANVPQVDGQLIYVKDTKEVYMDVGETRNNITDFISKTNTTAFTPTQDYHPATKKYVDDNCVPYQPFPSGVTTNDTTQVFISSIRALNLPAGSTYLGSVTLSDMPFNGNAEVEVYIYPSNVVYCILRSANVSPYEWECNSHTYRGWEAVGKAYTDDKLSDYVQFTNYPTSTVGGVVRTSTNYAIEHYNGSLRTVMRSYSGYKDTNDRAFIGKATLENVINSSIILSDSTTPTTSTVGYRLGQLYLNTTDNKLYQLVGIDDTDPNNVEYNWQQIINSTDLTNTVGQINSILDSINGEVV